MPISLSAKKSLRKSIKNRKENVSWKNKYKEIAKKFLEKPSKEALNEIYSILDQLSQRNIFHKNKTKRLKSKFCRKIKATSSVETAVKKNKTKTVKKSKKVVK